MGIGNLLISNTITTTDFNVTGLTSLATTTISTQLGVPLITTLTGNLTINPTGNLIISKPTSISGDLTVSNTVTTTQLFVTSTSILGTVISGTWQGNIISIQYGGTGQNWSTVAQGNIPYFSATGVMSTLAPGTPNQLLITGGVGANPSWTNISSLLTAGIGISITGTTNATIANTGILSLTAGSGISISTGQNPTITNTGVLSLNSATGTLTLQGTTNQINVSTVGSTITLSTPQNIHTGASPTFNSLTLSSLTPGSVLFAGTGGTISQNNSNLFWDNTNLRLGIGTSIPAGILHVATGTINALVVDNSGNVGIGTINPQTKLHIEGGEFWLFNNGNNPRIIIGDNGLTGQYGYLGWDSMNDYYRIETDGTNGVKIKGNYVSIGNIYPSQPLIVGLGSTELFRVDSSGNVGIGTTTPNYKLDVQGSIRQTDATNCALSADVNGQIICTVSSQRYKTNIQDLSFDINKFLALNPRSFDWNTSTINFVPGEKGSIGFIAEEVNEVFPELVRYKNGQPEGIKYEILPVYLFKVVKDLVLGFTEKVKTSLNELGIIIENGVAKIKEIFTEKITTKQICLKGDDGEIICIDKNQLKELLNRNGASCTIINNNESNTNTTTNNNESNANNNIENTSSQTTNASTSENNTSNQQESVSNQNQSASENTTSTTTSSQTRTVNDDQSSSTESATNSNESQP